MHIFHFILLFITFQVSIHSIIPHIHLHFQLKWHTIFSHIHIANLTHAFHIHTIPNYHFFKYNTYIYLSYMSSTCSNTCTTYNHHFIYSYSYIIPNIHYAYIFAYTYINHHILNLPIFMSNKTPTKPHIKHALLSYKNTLSPYGNPMEILEITRLCLNTNLYFHQFHHLSIHELLFPFPFPLLFPVLSLSFSSLLLPLITS